MGVGFGLLEDVLHTYLHLPAVAVVVAEVVGLRVILAVGVLQHRVNGLLVGVHALILEHTQVVGGLLRNFGHTPAAVQQVADVHDVEAQLDGMFGLADIELKFFHQAQVELMHPGSAGGVALSVLAAVAAEVLVLLDECLESRSVLRILEVEALALGGDVDQVVGDAVSVHVITVAEAVAVGAVACIEEAQVGVACQALVLEGDGPGGAGDKTVRNDVLRALHGAVVRAVDGDVALPGADGVVAGQAADFLALGVRVGEHEAEVVDGASVHCQVGGPAVSLVGVAHHHGVLAVDIVEQGCRLGLAVYSLNLIGIDKAVIGTGEILRALAAVLINPFVCGLDVDVAQSHCVDMARVHELTGHGEGELHGYLPVYGEAALPHLRHMEIIFHTADLAAGHVLVFGKLRGQPESFYHLVHIGDHAAVELGKNRVGAGIACAVAHGILNHAGIGGHIGEEYQRQTAGEDACTATEAEAAVLEGVPVEAYAG